MATSNNEFTAAGQFFLAVFNCIFLDVITFFSIGFTQSQIPNFPVGIEKSVNDIVNLLRPTEEESSVAVVIYGFGGIGKTTLAEAVLAKINLHHYNYTKVALHREKEENDFKSLQQQILKECYPTYNNGKPVELQDRKDGRDRLLKASKCAKAKPILLFIDNGSSSYNLMELLPTYTEDALKVLFSDPATCDNIENEYLERILRICRGVLLALKIISSSLHKQSCALLLDALESEEEIKEEKLSDRLVDFVYVTSLFEAGSIATQEVDEELILLDTVIAKERSLAKDNRIMNFESLCQAGDEERLRQIRVVWLVNEKSNYALPKSDLSLMTKSLRVLALGDRMKFGKANEEMEFEELRFLRICSSITQLPVKLEALHNLKVFHGPSSIRGEVITSKASIPWSGISVFWYEPPLPMYGLS
ncbi:hypothetical protein SUGI_0221840 [Cryptomeria japonica]|nr:hypothetical protein SUGI_0221840 [Cryptomeria japonica]